MAGHFEISAKMRIFEQFLGFRSLPVDVLLSAKSCLDSLKKGLGRKSQGVLPLVSFLSQFVEAGLEK